MKYPAISVRRQEKDFDIAILLEKLSRHLKFSRDSNPSRFRRPGQTFGSAPIRMGICKRLGVMSEDENSTVIILVGEKFVMKPNIQEWSRLQNFCHEFAEELQRI